MKNATIELKKEYAVGDFITMIYKSWTYAKMTDSEKARLDDAFEFVSRGCITGNYKTRWNIMQAAYTAFLTGIGYDGPTWREPDPESIPF